MMAEILGAFDRADLLSKQHSFLRFPSRQPLQARRESTVMAGSEVWLKHILR